MKEGYEISKCQIYTVCLKFSIYKDMRSVYIYIMCMWNSNPWKKDMKYQNVKVKLCVLNFLFTRIWDQSIYIMCMWNSNPWKKDMKYQNAKVKLLCLKFSICKDMRSVYILCVCVTHILERRIWNIKMPKLYCVY